MNAQRDPRFGFALEPGATVFGCEHRWERGLDSHHALELAVETNRYDGHAAPSHLANFVAAVNHGSDEPAAPLVRRRHGPEGRRCRRFIGYETGRPSDRLGRLVGRHRPGRSFGHRVRLVESR